MPRHPIDLTGKRFGRLVAVMPYDKVKDQIRWECVCDCGKKTIVYGSFLRNGSTRSCGCLLTDFNKSMKKHGSEPKRLYRIWAGMRSRCYDKNNKDFNRYGGRGITVCQEWQDFMLFREWAFSNGYKEDLSIDRIDNTGPYCPQNCRWSTAKVQANNRTNNHKVSYRGETKNISEWADQFGLDMYRLYAAIRRGRTIEEVLRKEEKPNESL